MPSGHEHHLLYSLSIRNMIFHFKFLEKKVIIITFKHSTTIFFVHYNLMLQNFKRKCPRKACVNTEQIHWNVLMPPGHPLILLNSN